MVILVLSFKALAWWMTRFIAVLSYVLESTANVVSAGAALIEIRFAALPADANHPCGRQNFALLAPSSSA